MAPFEGSELAEILEAVSKIKHRDPESWYDGTSDFSGLPNPEKGADKSIHLNR